MFLLLALVSVIVLGNGCAVYTDGYGHGYYDRPVICSDSSVYIEPVYIGPSLWFWGGHRYSYQPCWDSHYNRWGYGGGYREHRQWSQPRGNFQGGNHQGGGWKSYNRPPHGNFRGQQTPLYPGTCSPQNGPVRQGGGGSHQSGSSSGQHSGGNNHQGGGQSRGGR